MRLATDPQSVIFSSPTSHLWQRASSLGVLFASLGFLVVSAFPNSNRSHFYKALLPVLFVAMIFAVFLTAYSLWNLRAQHQGSDRAFRNAECEFSSIFQNALDGILIVDNEGDCLDANPAAGAICGVWFFDLMG